MSTLLETNDAMIWAEEFCRIFAGKVVTTEDSEGVDPGLMVGWFANAMGVGEQFGVKRLPEEGALHAFLHFYHLDKSNAAFHCSAVRFSPVTFRLAELLMDLRPIMSVDNEALHEVIMAAGTYEEDRGR